MRTAKLHYMTPHVPPCQHLQHMTFLITASDRPATLLPLLATLACAQAKLETQGVSLIYVGIDN